MDAKTRSEIRRRKILENAEARLLKIKGQLPDPGEPAREVNGGPEPNGVVHVEPRERTPLPQPTVQPQPTRQIFTPTNDLLLFLALGFISRLLYTIIDTDQSFIVPFLMVGLPRAFWPGTSTAALVLSFLPLSPRVASICQKLLQVLGGASLIAQLFAYYTFSFVVTHALLSLGPPVT